MEKSRLFQLAGLMVVALLLSGCLSQTKTVGSGTEKTVSAQIQIVKDNTVFFDKKFDVAAGKNALDVLLEDANLQIDYKEYAGMGVFVNSINGIKSNNDYFWALYVDDSFADKAIDKYSLDKDAKITWKFEKVDYSKLS